MTDKLNANRNRFFNFAEKVIKLFNSEDEWEGVSVIVEVYNEENVDEKYSRIPVTDIYWDQDTATVVIKID